MLTFELVSIARAAVHLQLFDQCIETGGKIILTAQHDPMHTKHKDEER